MGLACKPPAFPPPQLNRAKLPPSISIAHGVMGTEPRTDTSYDNASHIDWLCKLARAAVSQAFNRPASGKRRVFARDMALPICPSIRNWSLVSSAAMEATGREPMILTVE